MCEEENNRAEVSHTMAEIGVEHVRLSRRGPPRSHQAGSERNPDPSGAGLPPEPETERRRFGRGQQHKPIVLRIGPEHPLPRATVKRDVADFEDYDAWEHLRAEAWEWNPNESGTAAKAAVRATGGIALAARTDLTIVGLYGLAL